MSLLRAEVCQPPTPPKVSSRELRLWLQSPSVTPPLFRASSRPWLMFCAAAFGDGAIQGKLRALVFEAITSANSDSPSQVHLEPR